MGKSRKKSQRKGNAEKGQSDNQISVTQESKESGAQIDSQHSDTSKQEIEDAKDSEVSNRTKLPEESDSILEDIAQSDMKRKSRSRWDESDPSGSEKRRAVTEFPNSKYKRDSKDWNKNTDKFPTGRRSEPYRRNQNDDLAMQKKRSTMYENNTNREGTRDNSNNRRRSNRGHYDEEFSKYENEFASHKGDIQYRKTVEVVSDLFESPQDYALAHCVAVDMNMGSGIAVQFRYRFQRVAELLNQRQEKGGLAILKHKERFIYYLVTKQFSTGKPTYYTLFSSLKKLREHMVENGVKKIAMPRIGCGLDRLDWDNVKFMIEFLFKDEDVDIVVCNLEPTADSSPQKHRNCRVTNETYPIQDIEGGTVIIYFSSEDECVSEEMKQLDEKFHFLSHFKYARKTCGNVVVYNKNPDYLLCGCIVRKSAKDPFDFMALQKCLQEIQKENKKSKFYYYAFQALKDTDSSVNYKIINVLRNSLREVEVYVCWPGDLQEEMVPKDRFSGLGRESSFNKGDDKSKSVQQNYTLPTTTPKTEQNWRSSHNKKSWADECEESLAANSSSQEQNTEVDWFQNASTFPIDKSEKNYSFEIPEEPKKFSGWPEPDLESEISENQNYSARNFQKPNSNSELQVNRTFRNNQFKIPEEPKNYCDWPKRDLESEIGVNQQNYSSRNYRKQNFNPESNATFRDNSFGIAKKLKCWSKNECDSEINENRSNYFRKQNFNADPIGNSTYSYEYYTCWSDGEDQQSSSKQEQKTNFYETVQTSQLETNQDNSWKVDNWENPEPASVESEKNSKPEEISTPAETSFDDCVNHEYESFQLDLESGSIDCTSLKEQQLPNLPKQYSRVCYAKEDLIINDGIPPGPEIDEFVGKLLIQNEKAGGVAYLKEGYNFLYCLIISGANIPPTSYTIFSAIQKLRDHALKNRVKKLVIPKMDTSDCDFKWSDVKCMFQFLLGKLVLEITVATFETTFNSISLMKKNNNKLTHVKSPIHQMKKKSAIIYIASVDGVLTEEMKGLTVKFQDFKVQFQKKKKYLGDVIRYKENEDHVVYGCVVKRTHTDRINFEMLQKCLKEVNEQNAERLPVVGIQAINDQSEGVNFKIRTLMLTCLRDIAINMCWPGDLRSLMPGTKA